MHKRSATSLGNLLSVLAFLTALAVLGTLSASGDSVHSPPTDTPPAGPTPGATDPRGAAHTASGRVRTAAAPGYCSSSGGSTEFEAITSVSLTPESGGTMRLVVQVYIANPAGCTAGAPCPSYDSSPEYVNVWIDWNDDKSWQASEKVLDKALTGYLSINYHGTMTAISQFTPPASATTQPTWLRANLGWSHDPNDACEASWTWGNVVDKQVIVEPPKIKSISAQGIGSLNSQPETGRKVRLEAEIEMPAGYEIDKCSWTGDLTAGAGDKSNKCRYEYTPATGAGPAVKTYGDKHVTLTLTYKHMASGATAQLSKDHTYKVFFRKDGDDDSDCAWWSFWNACEPNWFEYWGDDGAVPKLNDANVLYDSSLPAGSYGYWRSSDDKIRLGSAAAQTHYPGGITVPAGASCPGGTFGGATGIDAATEVVEHEGRHDWIYDNWQTGGAWVGLVDSDQTGNYDDDLPDSYEISTTRTSTTTVDSCSLRTYKHPDYKYYGDNEFAVMVYSNGRTGAAANDWANPGKQSVPPFALAAQDLAGVSAASGPALAISSAPAGPVPLTDLARLTGSYADTRVDTDADGLYNGIVVSVGVQVTSTALYNVIAWLEDGTATTFAWANSQSSLITGTHTVPLTFDGLLVRLAGTDGPYRLAQVELRVGDEEALVASASHVYTTGAYTRVSFDPRNVALSGSFSSVGIDAGSDGLYDSLRVSVGLTVSQAGTYTITGQLEGSQAIDVASTTMALSAGGPTVTLDFRGAAIFSQQQNGPYHLRALRVENASGRVIEAGYDAYTTTAYTYGQFQHGGTTIGALSFTDQGLDVDGDGDYDYLRVRFQVSADQQGAYRLLATLNDSAGRLMATFVQDMDLLVGTNTIDLDFPGGDVRRHAANGPYEIASLDLLRPDGTIADYRQPAHTTQAYSYASFSLPLVSETGSYRDRTPDADSDGRYDSLAIDIGVVPGDAGVIVAQGRLVDMTGYEIQWSESFTEVVAGLAQTITLVFDGEALLSGGRDGPYQLRDLLIYHTGDPAQSVLTTLAHTTAFYSYSAFEGRPRSLFLPLIARSFAAVPVDPYEPNDTPAQAYGPLASGVTYTAYITPDGDLDYFYFDISTLGRVTVDLSNINAPTADYDLELYDSSGLRVGGSWGVTVTEQVVFEPAATGRYYVLVYFCCGANSPTRPYNLRVQYNGAVGAGDVNGTVYANGSPRANTPLILYMYDYGTYAWQRVWGVTNGSGQYHFHGLSTLGANQVYYAEYYGSLGPSYIGYWYTGDLTSYTAGATATAGNLDISPLNLGTPNSTTGAPLPVTFTWTPRTTSPSEAYWVHLWDPSNSTVEYWSGNLGHVAAFTLTGLPAGFALATAYRWAVYPQWPDGSYGASYYAYSVAFSSSGVMIQSTPSAPALVPRGPMHKDLGKKNPVPRSP